MSRFNDENDSSDFNRPEGTDPVIRELRAEIIRLEARLDQLTASVREHTEESIVISVRLAELQAIVGRLRARRLRDAKLLALAWLMVGCSLALSLYTYLTQ